MDRAALCLTIRLGQRVKIGENIEIYPTSDTPGRLRIVFLVPREVKISRTDAYGPEESTRDEYKVSKWAKGRRK